MKKTQLAYLLAILLLVLNGCHESDTPKSTCKVTQIVSTATNSTGNSSYNSTFEYNTNGQLVSLKIVNEEKDASGESTTSTSTSYGYDTNGYLTSSTSENLLEDSGGTVKVNSISEYEYENGRLVKMKTNQYTGEKEPLTLTSVFIYTYDYDSNGKLIKFSNTYTYVTYTASTIYDFISKEVTMTGYTGVVTKGELDAEGYLTKEVNPAGIERRYQYDGDGDLIREEEWTGGKMDNATVYEYDTKVIDFYSQVYFPQTKGIPDLKIYRSEIPIHLYTKVSSFDVDGQGKEVLTSTKSYSIQHNATGYPTYVAYTENGVNGTLISKGDGTYTYTDCQ